MADIANGSLYMAAADKAASAIESILNDQIASVIDQAQSEGLITNARKIALKKRGEAVGAHVVSLVLDYHNTLIDAAKDANVDLPPPSDGTTELIGVIQNMVSPLSGGPR